MRRQIKGILIVYGECSGQVVNLDKSGIFFSSNVIEENRRDVKRILGVESSANPEKYLGLPAIVGRARKGAFANLKDKFGSGIQSWNVRVLSQGGKEVFIKSVLQAIPMYAINCFLLPETLCKELEGLTARFWWQKTEVKRGIHWCSWEELSRLKEDGGLGFRDMGSLILLCWPSKDGGC
ncbi:uncharacterized protein LOC120121932 [Hibiscus syriacus]|uniref:uncharacterized protein LOC120121932 n=1 Tax=Hibiscus syriacus TaxID=106335 RepID=UPI001921D356|nr:uncharacterized protein LOC120121932 [Hibiscus syriacus]